MSEPYVAARVDELPEGRHIVVTVRGREIGLFHVGGRYYALPNACFHQNGPVCRGRVTGTYVADETTGFELRWAHEGEVVICPWHGLEFHIATGRSLAYPRRKLPVHDVDVVGDRLQIVAGDVPDPGR